MEEEDERNLAFNNHNSDNYSEPAIYTFEGLRFVVNHTAILVFEIVQQQAWHYDAFFWQQSLLP